MFGGSTHTHTHTVINDKLKGQWVDGEAQVMGDKKQIVFVCVSVCVSVCV